MKKILVVDDSITIQKVITKFFLKRTSYKIITAEDGEIALDQVKNDPPDFIILDIVLPRINGIAFLRDLRKMETTKNIPVILISGEMVDEGIKKEGFALGAVDFIEKPMDMQYLLDKVNSFLSPENP
ncbi:PleD family two-component system response regulator [Candidatus Latescibacterota bacterium]